MTKGERAMRSWFSDPAWKQAPEVVDPHEAWLEKLEAFDRMVGFS